MNTTLRPRVQVLQDLVLTYFRAYEKQRLAVIVEKPQLGAVEIAMTGQLAARFETLTVPDTNRAGYRLLRLLLDPEYASIAIGYETIAPRSHLVFVIKNDLAGEGCYARSVAQVSLKGSFDDLVSLGVSIAHANPSARVNYPVRRFYVVTYVFRQIGSEQNEDSVRIVVDALTRRPLPEVLVARFNDLTLTDLSEIPADFELAKAPTLDRPEAEAIIEIAMRAAESRALLVAQQRANAEIRKHTQERAEIDRLYEAELKNAMPARRGEIETSLRQAIEGLERRYSLRSELTLQSLQEILVPVVHYTLVVNGSPLQQEFRYDPLDNRVSTSFCTHCGENEETLAWAYCGRGHHLECGRCNTVQHCSVPDCTRSDCATHAVRCSGQACTAQLCPKHEIACTYCQSSARYCGKHINSSFEKQPICTACANECQACHELFPGVGVSECNVCGRTICRDDQLTCPGCNKPFCADTDCGASVTGHGTTRYCRSCQESCVECEATNIHFQGDLVRCGDCGDELCQNHAKTCTNCKKTCCSKHALNTVQGVGCAGCFASCRTCQSAPVLRKDMRSCRFCPAQDGGLHCTKEKHAIACTVCRQYVCQKHRFVAKNGDIACRSTRCGGTCHHCKGIFSKPGLTSCTACTEEFCADHLASCSFCKMPFCEKDRVTMADKRIACRTCAAPCALCNQWHKRDSIRACKACGRAACADDRKHSEFRDEYYCNDHAKQFADCLGCVRRGPKDQLAVCAYCSQRFCQHCKSQEKCDHCQSFSDIELNEETREIWSDRFEQVDRPDAIDDQCWESVRAALGTSAKNHAFACTSTPHLELLRGSFHGGLLGFVTRYFHKVRSFVLVWNVKKSKLTIRVNP